MRKPLTIAVIGGGLGGTSAALSLLRAGFAVELFEQAPALAEIGAGIQISPNVSRILLRLVPEEVLSARAVRPLAVHQRRWDDGRTLQRAVMGDAMAAAFGAPYYHFHRADLLTALAGTLPPQHVHLGHGLVDLEERSGRVLLRFANGEEFAADLAIGADGIRSVVRERLFGPDAPRFTGCIAYRALVPRERVEHLGIEVIAGNWMGPGRHLVHYFVGGGRFLNMVGAIERDAWTKESWTEPGRVGDFLAAYEGWHPQVRGMIAAAEQTFVWGLFDRPPLPRWSKGRVTLLGDACHPMVPYMAQGAAMAMEDAVVLARCLDGCDRDGVQEAFTRYESVRKERTSRVQLTSHLNQWMGGNTNADWVYGYDAWTVPLEPQLAGMPAT